MERTGAEVASTFEDLGNRLFDFSVKGHLANKGRSLVIYRIADVESDDHELIWGEHQAEIHSLVCTIRATEFVAYCHDLGDSYDLANVHADVLLAGRPVLAGREAAYLAMLSHELCHLLADSGAWRGLDMPVTADDKLQGQKLHRRTDTENQEFTRHDPLFCTLAAMAARRLREWRPDLYAGRWGALNEMMKYDMRGPNLRR